MSFRFHRIAFTSIALGLALAAACNSDNSNTDEDGGGAAGEGGQAPSGGQASTGGRTASGGTGGEGTGGAPTVEADIYGAWLQDCPAGQGGASSGSCSDGEPWGLVLGKTDVLGGPLTMVSTVGAVCGDVADNSDDEDGEPPYISGTFGWDGSQLELFKCDSDPQNGGMAGAGARGRVFDVVLSSDGKRMTLTSGDVEWNFDRQEPPELIVRDVRLISAGADLCDGGSIQYQSILSDEEAPLSWLSTVLAAGDELIMDEFFDTRESGEGGGSEARSAGVDGWSFYGSNDRGAQTAVFPTPSNTLVRAYRITHAPDLTPLFAVGFEVDDCSDEATPRGFEYDFQREVVFRRYWQSLDNTSGVPVNQSVSGLSGKVREVIVTVYVSGEDAADAEIKITSPDGTTVVLAAGENGDGTISEYYYTSFSDRASTSVTNDALTTFEDQLRPENPLSAFVGENKNGDWVLNVDSSESLSVNYFGLSIR